MKVPVVLAYGIQARDLSNHDETIAFLDKNAVKKKDGIYTHKRGKVEYDIRVVYTKREFADALNVSGAVVVYYGHARFGQGPAFGDAGIDVCPDKKTYPLNPWEDHFRMGYGAVEVPLKREVFHHCTNPKELPRFHPPDLRPSPAVRRLLRRAHGKKPDCGKKGVRRRSFGFCHPTEAKAKNGRGVKTLLKRHYWREKGGGLGPDFQTIVLSGSEDLERSDLRCSVLFLYGCKTKPHFYETLERRRKAAGSRVTMFMTQQLAGDTEVLQRFLKLLLLEGVNPRSKRGGRKYLKRMNALGSSVGKIVQRPKTK